MKPNMADECQPPRLEDLCVLFVGTNGSRWNPEQLLGMFVQETCAFIYDLNNQLIRDNTCTLSLCAIWIYTLIARIPIAIVACFSL